MIGAHRAMGLIAAGPRSPTPGAPYAFVTTKTFLTRFGFDTLRDLPVSRCSRTPASSARTSRSRGSCRAGSARVTTKPTIGPMRPQPPSTGRLTIQRDGPAASGRETASQPAPPSPISRRKFRGVSALAGLRELSGIERLQDAGSLDPAWPPLTSTEPWIPTKSRVSAKGTRLSETKRMTHCRPRGRRSSPASDPCSTVSRRSVLTSPKHDSSDAEASGFRKARRRRVDHTDFDVQATRSVTALPKA